MALLLLLLPSLSLALSPPPFFPPQWAPPVPGGVPFAEGGGGYGGGIGGGGGGPGGVHEPPISFMYGNQYNVELDMVVVPVGFTILQSRSCMVDVECIVGQAAGHSKQS
uniref:Uncharacterized protein n=1 Tax=Oryza punctata TaxID=4537 RepID=A0A0E0JX87_ORYPU